MRTCPSSADEDVPTQFPLSGSDLVGVLPLIGNDSMRELGTTLPLGLAAARVGLCACGKIRYPHYYVLKRSRGRVELRTATEPCSGLGCILAERGRGAENPRCAATQAMARELQAPGVFDLVDVFDGRTTSIYMVTGALDHLEEVDDDSKLSIEVDVAMPLADAGSREVLWQATRTRRLIGAQRRESFPQCLKSMASAVDRAGHLNATSAFDGFARCARIEH